MAARPTCPMIGAKTTLRVYRLAPSIGQFFYHARFGGADRDRTGDLLLAKQALSQLSYSPLKSSN